MAAVETSWKLAALDSLHFRALNLIHTNAALILCHLAVHLAVTNLESVAILVAVIETTVSALESVNMTASFDNHCTGMVTSVVDDAADQGLCFLAQLIAFGSYQWQLLFVPSAALAAATTIVAAQPWMVDCEV